MKDAIALRLEEAREHREIVLALNTVLERNISYIEDKRRSVMTACREKLLHEHRPPAEPPTGSLVALIADLQKCDELLVHSGFEKIGPKDYRFDTVDRWATELHLEYLRKRSL